MAGSVLLRSVKTWVVLLLAMCHAGCVGPETGETLKLSWKPNPSEEQVLGYKVYKGRSPTEAKDTEVFRAIAVTEPGFDPQTPAVEFHAEQDLGLKPGAVICFRVKAYNKAGDSPFSDAACTLL
jgi:hypothetical protein